MAYKRVQPSGAGIWALARRQHGVVTRGQLIELGLSAQAIHHRVVKGRLHPAWRGIYAVGRPQLSQSGRWMAAVLSCGPEAVLSHRTAAALWEIRPVTSDHIELSVPASIRHRRPGIVVHRRTAFSPDDVTRHIGIPVTTPICTLIDIAARLEGNQLEAAINEADKLNLVDPDALRSAIASSPPRPGLRPLRETLDRRTFTLTDSELERRFLPVARRAGLPTPQTGRREGLASHPARASAGLG